MVRKHLAQLSISSRRRRPAWSSTFAAPVAPPKGRCALALGACQLEGNAYAEDAYSFDVFRRGWNKISLLSVYDGHGGWQVARFLQAELTPMLRQKLQELSESSPKSLVLNENHVKDALRQTYTELDQLLCKRLQPSLNLGFTRFACIGACSLTVAVLDSQYVVANAGDSTALLYSGGKAVAMSRTHNVDIVEERERVRREHPLEDDVVQCQVTYEDQETQLCYKKPGPNRVRKEMACYIKGVLGPSRAFGDFALKHEDMNPLQSKGKSLVSNAHSMPYITAEPEILVFPRRNDDLLLVLCSDGVTEFLSNEEIVGIADAAGTPAAAAKAITSEVCVRAAKEAKLSMKQYRRLHRTERRQVHDDATALVFYLSHPQQWLQQWTKLSDSLQNLCDKVSGKFDDLGDLAFSVSIADPSLDDCPLIAVSKGFEQLTGYRPEEVIGRNCRFLAFDVPEELQDQETTERLQAYMKVANSGDPFSIAESTVASPSWAPEASSNAACFLRWNRRRDGELFQNLFLMRQIWVGDRAYILALQTRLEETPQEGRLDSMALLCMFLSKIVLQHMDAIESMLSSQLLSVSY